MRGCAVDADMTLQRRTAAMISGDVLLDIAVIEQPLGLVFVEQRDVVGDRVARIDHDPDAVGAVNAEHRDEAFDIVRAVDRDLLARRQAVRAQRMRDPVGQPHHLAIAVGMRSS